MAKKNIFDLGDKFNVNSPFNVGNNQGKVQSASDGSNSAGNNSNDSDSSENDVNTTDAATDKRYVYLTFDDGLEPGTEEVLKVLKDNGVKGTFFLTGMHLKEFIENTDRALGLKMLKEIHNDHYIGNHSYSHANFFYKNYYDKGLKIGKNNNGFIYRSVLEDFQKNDELIKKYIKEAGISTGDKWSVARLPGRNTWYGDNYKNAVSDTEDEAIELLKNDYFLIGWDVSGI